MNKANISNSVKIVEISKKTLNLDSEQTVNYYKKKKTSETTEASNSRLGATDKSVSKSLSTRDLKGEIQMKKDFQKNSKIIRNKTLSLADSNKKARVKFKRDFISTVEVESYKKYNEDMSNSESEAHETTKCRCLVF